MKLVSRPAPCLRQSLADVQELVHGDASGYLELEPGCTQSVTPVAWEGNGDRARLRRYTGTVAPLRILALGQARLYAAGVLADEAGNVFCPEEFAADEVLAMDHPVNLLTGAYHYDPASATATANEALAVRRVDQPCLVLSQCGWDIYGHWLLDILPKLPLLRRLPGDVPVLLPTGLAPWQLEHLELLGVGADRVITYDPGAEVVQLRRALCVSHPRQYYALNACANAAYEQILAALPAPPARGRRLYVSRRRLTSGKQDLVNSAAIEEMLLQLGFEVVEPETMSARQQVQCFAAATLVVGEQGSGLHNTAFSPRGTRVLCLHSERAQFFAQAGLGHIRAQPTGFIFGRHRADLDTYGTDRVFEVDPVVLRRVLEQTDFR